MKNKELFKTNALVSVILVVGFAITAILSYRANYQDSLDYIERVSGLAAEGLYQQINKIFTKPINISQAMSRDSLLVEHLLEEKEHMGNEDHISSTKQYLKTYYEKYGFDSVFLVSSASRRYYNFNGVDRILLKGNAENEWYFELMNSSREYSLNVDNDEVAGADNAMTIFVNCKVFGQDGTVLGVVGIGMRVDYLKEMLAEYERTYDLTACLVDEDGRIIISNTYAGHEASDWFHISGQEGIREQVLGWEKDLENLELWLEREGDKEKNYVVSRYIREMSWHLIVEQNDNSLIRSMQVQLYQTSAVIVAVVIIILLIITTVIRNFNKQIMELTKERQTMFQKATEQLYDKIYELNITRNSSANRQTEQYFQSLGVKGLSYEEGLQVIAEKEVKKEYQKGYLEVFGPKNVLREFEAGNNHLSYDFLMSQDGSSYFWMRIDAYIFLSSEDGCIHMFAYRKNIDDEKKKELQASFDEMTKFLTKTATERRISTLLTDRPEDRYAFFLLDIDDFKQVNDQFGHAFGDYCIKQFTSVIRRLFKEEDILGRVGGDEFAVFVALADIRSIEERARELQQLLNVTCTMDGDVWKLSASIGISIAPEDGVDFDTLYRKADIALYQTKQKGKNGYTIS